MAAKAERFLTTVLFTDIVGSTELAAELGDRGWRDLVQEHHRLVRASLRRHRGREIDTAGDSFFAVFDAPAAAVECALEIIDEVKALGLQVRAGLHVGEVEQIAGKVGGITVPIASRIMASADGGEVLVSSTVHDLATGAGFTFEDRGSRELKGVRGEWRLFSVGRENLADASAQVNPEDRHVRESENASRRAAAVRRAQARPIWQRHPRASVGVALLFVGLLVTSGLLVWRPWLPPILTSVSENSIGIVEPERHALVGTARVGNQPAAIALGEGSVWVANAGDDSVSQVDPGTRAVIDTIDVGKTPTGVAVGAGSVWVANSAERTVSRINAATRRVVDTITVGNAPRSVAFGANRVWVTNSGDGTVVSIDPGTGAVSAPLSFGTLPSAVAADDRSVWVISEEGNTVIQLDAATGTVRSHPIAVGSRPSAVAIGDGVVWVANTADGSVSKIDPEGQRISGVIDVGGAPASLALDGETLWIADRSGSVARVDLNAVSAPVRRVAVGAAPEAIVVVNGSPWFIARANAASHRGGTLRLVGSFVPTIDPANLPYPEFTALTGDGLVGYRRVGGIAGAELLPNLATVIPRPTDGGLTYTFQLRQGLVYSDGSVVRAGDFRNALERVFQVGDEFFGNAGAGYFSALAGADECADAPVARCDLSRAVETDDDRGLVTFHLAQPDTDFLFKLAMSFTQPIPAGAAPANELINDVYPTTGPYAIESVTGDELRLVRNPHFQTWDPAVRPDGYVDEVIWTFGIDGAEAVRLIETGEADYLTEQIPADAFSTMQTQFTPQLHITASTVTRLFMNTKLPPFDQLDVRRALNFALDRSHVATLRGGPVAAQPTCQILPPSFPGYLPYCPYTRDPDASGRWSAADLDKARQLVSATGTQGQKVVVGPMPPRLDPVAEYVASVLRDLGYDSSTETVAGGEEVYQAVFVDKRVQVGGFEYLSDFPAPDTFLSEFACDVGNASDYCDPTLDAAIAAADDLQVFDPAAAKAKWAEVDRMVTDLALWAPVVNEGSDFVSARLGNYQYSPGIGFLADQAWVQ